MSYEKPKNENETLSDDERRLREICLSLKKVDAPKDFDFKLRARIADSKASDFQPRFGFAFRYAMPALALIMFLGLLAYNSGFWSSPNNQIIAGGNSETVSPTLPQNSVVSSFAPSETKETSNENSAALPSNQNLPKVPERIVAEKRPQNSRIEKKRESKNDNFKGSDTSTFKIAPVIQPIEPENVPQNSQNNESQNIEKINLTSVKEILSTNGINADFENGKWTVKSVRANSLGESSGVKENDIIEAIDDQPLSAETVFNKTAGGKTITVTRKGEKSPFKLRIKQ